MGYRNRGTVIGIAKEGERCSIGDMHVESGIDYINKLAAISVNTLTEYGYDLEHTLPMLFSPKTLSVLHDAYGLTDPSSTSVSYEVAEDVGLMLNFKMYPKMLPPKDDVLDISASAGPLRDYIDKVMSIHFKFEQVKAVLKWMNRHATPGAIRYYWPTAMKLTPKAPVWRDLQECPTRYTTPEGLGRWSYIIKEAAGTVSSALLLPATAMPKAPGSGMYLTFGRRGMSVAEPPDNTRDYDTDRTTYHM